MALRIFLTLTAMILGMNVQAQSADNESVKAVIIDIFDGMRAGDSSRVSSHFLRDATMMSVSHDKNGNSIIQKGSLQGWLNAIGTPRETILDERLWGIQVAIDDNLATVWTNYAFYVGSEYSHCGIDAFQLYHDGKDWKVFHVADTRRKDCDIPEHILQQN
jgi:ketosteroid isomerase-like protein